MYNPTTVLHKILEIFPRYEFEKIVSEFKADRYSKSFTTWNQLLTIFVAQAKGWDSLREVVTGFNTHISKLYHLGFSKKPSRSTISRVNASRNPEIYERFFYKLKEVLQPKLIRKKFDFDLTKALKIIDSTTVELSIKIFKWAKFRYNKGALKIHTSFNLTDQIPEFINMTDGKTGDINGINFNSYHDCILTFDRAYIDFGWLSILDKNNVTYVCRAKKNFIFNYLGQHQKATVKGILKDEVIEFKSKHSKEIYPRKLRLVTFVDKDTGEVYRYMTNNFEYPAEVIAYIYKKRWEIELFFKWIKQNLKIKTFFGISENAVKTQIWIAMIYYMVLRYIQGQTNISSLLEFTRIMREIMLDTRAIFDIYSIEFRSQIKRIDEDVGQLNIFKI
jgi:IS4 transposase